MAIQPEVAVEQSEIALQQHAVAIQQPNFISPQSAHGQFAQSASPNEFYNNHSQALAAPALVAPSDAIAKHIQTAPIGAW